MHAHACECIYIGVCDSFMHASLPSILYHVTFVWTSRISIRRVGNWENSHKMQVELNLKIKLYQYEKVRTSFHENVHHTHVFGYALLFFLLCIKLILSSN